jgi:hypothetical protein
MRESIRAFVLTRDESDPRSRIRPCGFHISETAKVPRAGMEYPEKALGSVAG